MVAAKDGTDKAIAAKRITGCMLVQSGWLAECYYSMTLRDVKPFLMCESKKIGYANDTEDEDDDSFVAELEDEMIKE